MVFRVGRGEGRLSTVATTQPWTHLVLELRGLPPHCPGIGHVQASRYVETKVARPPASWLSEASSRCCPDASVGLQLVATSASLGQPRPISRSAPLAGHIGRVFDTNRSSARRPSHCCRSPSRSRSSRRRLYYIRVAASSTYGCSL